MIAVVEAMLVLEIILPNGLLKKLQESLVSKQFRLKSLGCHPDRAPTDASEDKKQGHVSVKPSQFLIKDCFLMFLN